MKEIGFNFGEKTIKGVYIERKFIESGMVQTNLYHQKYKNTKFESPRANIVILPEVQDHCHRYNTLALGMADEFNLEVHLFDYIGFGRSDGIRSMGTPDLLFKSLQLCLNEIKNNKPIFLYGHGLGALLALTFFLQNDHLNFAG